MAKSGENDRRDEDEDPIVGIMHHLLLDLEHKFYGKINQVIGAIRHTMEQFHREHVIVEGMNQRPIEQAIPQQQAPLNNP